MSDLFLRHDRVPLSIEELIGPRTIATRRNGSVAIGGEAAARAIEQASRFALSPNWLIYLPPAPVTIARGDGDSWLSATLQSLTAQAEHCAFRLETGSRVYILVCRDTEVARARFAATGNDEIGAAWTCTGRAVFADQALKSDLLLRLRRAAESAGLWASLATDWLLVEAEVSPWSDEDRAQRLGPLLTAQTECHWSCGAARAELTRARARGVPADALLSEVDERAAEAQAQLARSRRHLARSTSFTPLRILAGEGNIWIDAADEWQAAVCAGLQPNPDPVAGASAWRVLSTDHPGDCARISGLIDDYTDVVIDMRTRTSPDVRRMIRISNHAPSLGLSSNLSAWLNDATEARAQHALGYEALERFIDGESATRVHQCVLGMLALQP